MVFLFFHIMVVDISLSPSKVGYSQWFEASGYRDSNNSLWVNITHVYPVKFETIDPKCVFISHSSITDNARTPIPHIFAGTRTNFNGGLDSAGLDLAFNAAQKFVYVIAVGA